MKALENLKFLKEDPNIGFQRETLELMSFCDTLNAIKEIDIVDISGKRVAINPWTKFKERLRNKDEFRQALYEMQIAVALKRSGFKTFFIQESAKKGEKTSDLLVEDNGKPIHIECKYRGPTHREQQYDNTFKEFYSRSMRLMHHLGKFYFVCVEWLKDPSIEHLESEISGLERRLSNGEQGYFETKNIKIWLKQLASKEQVFEGCYSFDISGYKSDDNHADIIMQKADIGIFDGVPKYKNPTLVMFRNISYMDDLVNGIIELLNKAYPQIPEKSPGIIFIEARVSFLNQRIKETLQDLERRLIGKLKLTERVNMVILTKSAFMERNIRVNEKDAKIIARVVESRMIPNRKPKSPISQDLLKRLRTLKFY